MTTLSTPLSIKEELIQLIKSLDHLSAAHRAQFGHLLVKLDHSSTIIPETTQGRDSVCYFLYLLTRDMPELMTDTNKLAIQQFAKKIGLAEKLENKPPHSRRK